MIVGGLAGGIIGFIMAMFGASTTTIQYVAGPIGGVIGLVISIIPLKLILNKNFGEFSLVLVKNDAP